MRFVCESLFTNLMTDPNPSRTTWAEAHVERFIAPAFVAEFVFRNLQVLDVTQKEVADFLIHRGEQAVLVSQKCQDDPRIRADEKLQRWARKRAEHALSQIKGALRRVGDSNEIWCDHPRRGRVVFPTGLPHITHAIVTVEVFEHVSLRDDLPLENRGTPISYLSVSDFLNVCQQLRTVPEVVRYLHARRSLPESILRSLGAEQVVFSYYLLSNGDFAGFTSIEDAKRTLSDRNSEFTAVLSSKTKRDRDAMLLEHVADQLAGRHPQYEEGLSQTVLDRYEPIGERRGYLKMQDLVAGMNLGERGELGHAFVDAISNRKDQGGTGLTFAAAMVSSHPDCVFVFGSFGATENFTRNDLLSLFEPLTRAAMAYYGRTQSLIIIDRDGQSYEVGLNALTSHPSQAELEAGHKVFGALKVFGKEVRLRPNVS